MKETELRAQLNAAKDRITALENENGVLATNISVLYKTAKLEIDQQKDRIKSLEKEVNDLRTKFAERKSTSFYGNG